LILLLALADVQRDARTLNLARTLARAGKQVCIISGGTLHERDSTPTPAGGTITIRSWTDPGGSALTRWRSFTSFASAQKDLRATSIGAMDLFALAAATRLKRAAGGKLVYDAREFYFALGPRRGKGIRQRMISSMEWYLIKKADVITVSGELDAEIIRDRYHLAALPTVIMNVPPYRAAVRTELLRETCTIPIGSPIVLYQGVVHHGRGIRPMLDALPLLPNVHFCVIGDGPALEALKAEAQRSACSDRVHWLGAIDYDLLHAWTCSADVGLCLIEPISMSYEYALPNKLFEYVMAQIPVVASNLPAMHRMMQSYQLGVEVLLPLTADAVASAVRSALDGEHYGPSLNIASRLFSYEKQEESVLCSY